MADVGDPAPPRLATTVDEGGTGPVVTVAGEIDLANAASLEAVVDRLVEARPRRVTFDLHRLDFMDSSGLAVLVRCAARVPEVVVLHPSANVRRVIEVSGLGPLLLPGHVDETRRFPQDPRSVTEARQMATSLLAGLPADVVERATLMVSELASNAVRHANTGFVLRIRATPEDARVEVTDNGPGTPARRSPELLDPSGRGLLIVDSLADEWGVDGSTPTGKTVWFTVAVARALTAP
jgi:anti-anti-sigma factor